MAQSQANVVRIFIASPRDVPRERSLAIELVRNELANDPLLLDQVALQVVSWDDPLSDKPMPANVTPQQAIVRFGPRPAHCDIVIVILWACFGHHLDLTKFRKTNDEPYSSGTEWEFEDALYASDPPDILIYRKSGIPTLSLDDPNFENRRAELNRLNKFCDSITYNDDGSLKGAIKSYDRPGSFKKTLERDIRHLLREHLGKQHAANALNASTGPLPRIVWTSSPYPGLRAFSEEENPIFFGREAEVDLLLEKLNDPNQRFIALVSGSGAGKSSLLLAGVVPALKQTADRSTAKLVLTVRLGAYTGDPFLVLASTLIDRGFAPDRAGVTELAEALARHPSTLRQCLSEYLSESTADSQLVLIVDQLEEIFSAESFYNSFLRCLVDVIQHPRVYLVVTLRSDFLLQAMASEALAPQLQVGAIILGPPGPASLTDMIRKPALCAGFNLEPGLVDAIVSDAGANQGALPLVAFCLSELYRQHKGKRILRLAAYKDLGRLSGIIARRTSQMLSKFKQEAGLASLNEILSPLFSALVHVDATGFAGRRGARDEELHSLPAPTPSLINRLIDRRLLLADEVDGKAITTLAHDSLLTEWAELRDWIEINRRRMQRVQRLLLSITDAEPRDRAYAAAELVGIFPIPREACPALLAATTDVNAEVRAAVAKALGEILPSSRDTVNSLVTALRDADSRVRAAAATSLGKLNAEAPSVIPSLVAVLEDTSIDVQMASAAALGAFGSAAEEFLPLLLVALDDPNSELGNVVLDAVAKIGSHGVGRLLHLCADGAFSKFSERVSARVINLIGPPVIPALIECLAVRRTRSLALHMIGSFRSRARDALPVLISHLSDHDDEVRQEAVHAIAKIGLRDDEEVLAIIGALTDTNSQVRMGATYALLKCERLPQKGIPRLLEAILGEGDSRIQRFAAQLLKKRRISHLILPELAGAFRDWDRIGRLRAVALLGHMPISREVEKALEKATRDEDSQVRGAALKEIKWFRVRRARRKSD